MAYLNKIEKWFRFILSGGLAALSNLVLFYVFLNLFHIWYLIASVMSFLLSVVVGFYLQKYFTFKENRGGNKRKQMMMFLVVSLINLVINVLLMLLFVEVFLLDQMLSKVFTLAILACWNYFVYKKFVFVGKV